METDFSNISGMYKINTDIVNKAIARVSGEHWFLKPGDESNHLLWVLGHMVWARANTLKFFNEHVDIPGGSLFARGANLAAPEDYPNVDEIKSAWNEVSQKLLTTLASPPEEILGKPAPEFPPSFDGKISGNLAFLAFHDTYHVGQLSFLTKWLGYGQNVG